MASRQQVRELVESGLDYTEAAKRLGIPAGQAYLIGTGLAADGGDAPPEQASRPGVLPASHHLASPPHDNPASSQLVLDWIAGRVAADQPMREAAARRTAEPEPPKAGGKIEAAAKGGPTRPHRRAPRKPAAAVKAAVGAAAADRAHDVISHGPAERKGDA